MINNNHLLRALLTLFACLGASMLIMTFGVKEKPSQYDVWVYIISALVLIPGFGQLIWVLRSSKSVKH